MLRGFLIKNLSINLKILPMSKRTLSSPAKETEITKIKNMNRNKFPTKYIFVSGGVISGIGKGVTTSVLGSILKACGYPVTAIKIDPYLNIDAGTFSPYEHGEVFVLDDGSEVDLDLGNYERMLDISLSNDNNITTGKIYDKVIKKERKGLYLGKTVQVVPHITDEIQNWILDVAATYEDDSILPLICLIEVGGIIGDIESMPFLEAIRQFQSRVKQENICQVHVSLLPETCGGELKTKPTQMSVRTMRSLGLTPDFIVCRSSKAITNDIKSKISLFCDVSEEKIISLPNVSDIYQIMPTMFYQNIAELMCARLCLSKPNTSLPLVDSLLNFSKKSLNATTKITVAIVGKYVKQHDAYHSVEAALIHSALFYNHKIEILWVYSDHLENEFKDTPQYKSSWDSVKSASAIVIPGGFDKRGIEGKILATNYARIEKKPILGLCLGLQVMVIEFAKNVLGFTDANTTEIDPHTKYPVIFEMPEFNPSQKGGTMRLGLKKTIFNTADSHAKKLYGAEHHIYERHRHRFEFNSFYRKAFEEKGFKFVGEDDTGKRMEIVELPESTHPYFVGVQFHPEFLSRPLYPSPPFLGLIDAAIKFQEETK